MRQTTRQNCRVPPVWWGRRDEKGAMARQTTVKTLPRTVSVAGGRRDEESELKENTGARVLKAKLALKWTGPYKVLAVGPCSSAETPDGSPLGDNLLYLDLPSDLPGSDARRRVAIERCKPCANPHDSSDMTKYLLAGMTQYVLNLFPKKSPCLLYTSPSPRDGLLSRMPSSA